MSLTLAHFDQKHRELMDKILSLENGISALRKENSDLKQENSVLKSEVINLKKSCLQAELVSKRQNIILHGIPIVQGVDPETAARKLFTEIGVANANSLQIVKCYRFNANKQSGVNTRATKPASKPGSIFVSLANLLDKDEIMKNCGKLKGSGKSVSSDLPRDLARRRKELLAYGYSLRTSSDHSVKVAETRIMAKGINVWIEVKKTAKSKKWSRLDDSCYDPFSLSASISSALPPSVVPFDDDDE